MCRDCYLKCAIVKAAYVEGDNCIRIKGMDDHRQLKPSKGIIFS